MGLAKTSWLLVPSAKNFYNFLKKRMSNLLLIHITGGVLTGYVVFRSVFVLIKDQKEAYQNLVRSLSFLAAFEVLSGVLLAYSSPSITAKSLCANIALYLGLVALTYLGFAYRSKPTWQNIMALSAPVAGSLGVLVLAIFKGV